MPADSGWKDAEAERPPHGLPVLALLRSINQGYPNEERLRAYVIARWDSRSGLWKLVDIPGHHAFSTPSTGASISAWRDLPPLPDGFQIIDV